uniref:Uncharacterized protein n=1 Tax=Anguilla anguilla TaxID=7936 RepID=A0A0E9WRE3_ANGAN
MSSILSHLPNPADILTASTAIVEDQARFHHTLNLTQSHLHSYLSP